MRFREVRVVGSDGSQLGVMGSRQALSLAKEEGLDLLMVAAQAQPPVCRIVDHGKYKYETEKREKDNKRKQQDVKGIKLRPNTAENDLNTLIRNANKFLLEGDKVRVVCQFKAREVTHPENGLKRMLIISERLAEVSTIEKPASLDGRQMVMVLIPKAKPTGKKKDAENQDKQDGSEEIQDHGNGQDHSTEERE